MEAAKVALFACLALATGFGSWYLGVQSTDKRWQLAEEAGRLSMGQERYSEAERQFAMAVATARAVDEHDPRIGLSLFHLAQALVAQSKSGDALPVLRQLLALSEKALGVNHSNVAQVRTYYQALLLHMLDQSTAAVIERSAGTTQLDRVQVENNARRAVETARPKPYP